MGVHPYVLVQGDQVESVSQPQWAVGERSATDHCTYRDSSKLSQRLHTQRTLDGLMDPFLTPIQSPTVDWTVVVVDDELFWPIDTLNYV